MYIILYRDKLIKNDIALFALFALWKGKVQKVQKVQSKKMMWQKWQKWQKSGCGKIIYATYAIYASANFYTSGKIGRRYFLFVCPKLPKMIQKLTDFPKWSPKGTII